ncbi:hypothetical protein HSX10_15585 [Winogradskyella undariae]|uniref:hypothetical protein n=1 Tax=Winogradskyella TaxID=286104 RepID=UPI00156AFDB3|nr:MULTISPECIES: hypothetical protein [Winogradskyella]NRR92997.1 hypothetical protein [Winogradskyella undariae]QXP79262.1 hypothetical protein H0I32_01010 [Winogradskyella sp. HaHa_3_26]
MEENNIKKITIKKRIITGVFSGVVFAIFMSGFDYFDGTVFSLPKFIFHALFFGLFMGIALKYKVPKKRD